MPDRSLCLVLILGLGVRHPHRQSAGILQTQGADLLGHGKRGPV